MNSSRFSNTRAAAFHLVTIGRRASELAAILHRPR